jgi:hypothetical protein
MPSLLLSMACVSPVGASLILHHQMSIHLYRRLQVRAWVLATSLLLPCVSSQGFRVVAKVQTSPHPIDTPMIMDNPWSAIGVQISTPILPVCLAQGMQTVFDNILILTISVAVQTPLTPSLPQGIRLNVKIQTDMMMNSPVVPPSPSTPDQATQVDQDVSHSDGFGLSPLTSLSTFDLLPPWSLLPVLHSQELLVSPLPASPTPAQQVLC